MNGLNLLLCSFHCIAAPFYGPPSLLIIPLVLSMVIILATTLWRSSRSRQVLDSWAAKNGFQIIRRENRWCFRGPFAWSRSRCQTVYFVTVLDKDGLERSGWVRCGGWFTGLWSDAAEVRWLDLSNVYLNDDNWLQSLPRRWLWVIALIIVALAALLFLIMPKPALPNI